MVVSGMPKDTAVAAKDAEPVEPGRTMDAERIEEIRTWLVAAPPQPAGDSVVRQKPPMPMLTMSMSPGPAVPDSIP